MKKQKKEFNYKNILFGVMALFIFFVIIEIVFGQTYIAPDTCHSETIVVDFNETYNHTFEICALNQTCGIFNYSQLIVKLSPGEDEFYNGTYTNVTASCITPNITSDKCIVKKSLEPGDDIDIYSYICDVDVECEDKKCRECGSEIPTSYTIPFRIRFDNTSRQLKVDFWENHYQTQISNNIEINGDMVYECPTVVINGTESTELTLQQCQSIVPTYCGNFANLLIGQNDFCNERKQEAETSLQNCRDDVKQMVEESVCISNNKYADLLADQKVTLNETNRCVFEEGRLTRQLENENDSKTEMTFVILVLVAFNAFQFFRPKVMKRMSVMG